MYTDSHTYEHIQNTYIHAYAHTHIHAHTN